MFCEVLGDFMCHPMFVKLMKLWQLLCVGQASLDDTWHEWSKCSKCSVYCSTDSGRVWSTYCVMLLVTLSCCTA